MLRNFTSSTVAKTSTAATTSLAAVVASSNYFVGVRHFQHAKGRCQYRLDYTHSLKRGPEALKDLKEGETKKALKNPSNKKEELAHLLERPAYEYTPCFQRQADDMMAIQSDPRKFCDDMSYHFHRVGKQMNGSATWSNETSSCGQFNKLKAPH